MSIVKLINMGSKEVYVNANHVILIEENDSRTEVIVTLTGNRVVSVRNEHMSGIASLIDSALDSH